VKRGLWVIVVVAAALGLGAGAGVRYWWLQPEPAPSQGAAPGTDNAAEDKAVTGRQRPAFTLPDRHGEPRAIADFAGKVVLLNFWATWCPPCLEEVPALVELQQSLGSKGLQVVGVALDEAEAVRGFAREHGVGYPLLVGSRSAFSLAGEYGNQRGVLPYTVVIDREGTIRATHRGALTRQQARELVQPWL
jgi:peroxiredoxin